MKRKLHPLEDPSKAPLDLEDDSEVVYLFVPPILSPPPEPEAADAGGCIRTWIAIVLLGGGLITLLIGALVLGVGALLSDSANATLGFVLLVISLILQNLAERIRNYTPVVRTEDTGTNEEQL